MWPIQSALLFALIHYGSCSSSINSKPFFKSTLTEISLIYPELQYEPNITECKCRMKCGVHVSCGAVTYNKTDSTCKYTTNMTASSLAVGWDLDCTTWVKFAYTMSYFITEGSTTNSSIQTQRTICLAEGGDCATIATVDQKAEILRMITPILASRSSRVWLPIKVDSKSNVWLDETPVVRPGVFADTDLYDAEIYHKKGFQLDSNARIAIVNVIQVENYPVLCTTNLVP